ncbi:hypothetical protein I302_104406 [Kwoniella bestiolae CBS 10118]|uniref:GATA-type domain-containing protein n=1 Tax=Kwoniella bestiolae CBS 10118 TaxID=1296100 RepID=A0A1B9GB65_9TREE|nr:hypothetical protein I302_03110 [Kwoniella bestiolae CBS 10118]OCF28258.1 hypothetical protein I302_03110 [Kwoniella bestiolae CBS 10118]
MSVRALLRSHADFIPIQLPFQARPQFVTEDGYEYDPLQDTPEEEAEEDGVAADDEQEGGEEAEEVDQEIGGDEDGDVEMDNKAVEEQEEGEDEEEAQEPLLSIPDSLVLPYSLTQARLHHLTSLFPHIFSHPPIPSHSKPRIRPPPKGTFIYPTPSTPIHPLPNPEYHGPTITAESSSPAPGESSKSQDTTDPNATPQPTSKSSRPPRPKKVQEVEWPAHEIECISRCTLSVGHISFPGTEIWIGRFVEPRVTQPKKERAKPGERKEKRRLLAEEGGGSAKRSKPRKSATEGYTPRRPKPSASTPAATPTPSIAARPPPPPGPPAYRPPPIAPSVRPPPPAVRPTAPVPTRPTTASPQLIQLVNQAATRHAWLSALIYKAAGSTANQVELERLGKAVARLSRGEPIEDLAPPPLPGQAVAGPGPSTTAQSRPPPSISSAKPSMTSAIAPTTAPLTAPTPAPASASISSISPPAPAPATTQSTGTAVTTSQPAAQPTPAQIQPSSTKDTSESKAEDADSDNEVPMTGRPQVGGGPLPVDVEDTASAAPAEPARPAPSAQPVAKPPESSAETSEQPISNAPDIGTVPPAPTPDITKPSDPVPIAPPNVGSATQGAPATSFASPRPQLAASSPSERLPTPTPPPPPKPTYPLPPPFLLIAFKEQPTEKFLLPLGQRSFISRVGGEWVTGPRPPSPEPILQPEPQPHMQAEDAKPEVNVSTSVANDTAPISAPSALTNDTTPQDTPAIIAKPLRSRTRQSLGRHAKEPPAAIPTVPSKEPTPLPEPEVIEEPKVEVKPKPISGLPPLPGQVPAPGTVLISTFIPSGSTRWAKVDWEKLKEGLPFDNPIFWDKVEKPESQSTVEVKKESNESPSTSTIVRGLRHPRTNSDSTKKGKIEAGKPELLNLGAKDFMPSQGDLQPVTIRLTDISDEVWKKMRDLMEVTERHEIELMFRKEPGFFDGVDLENEQPTQARQSPSTIPDNHPPVPPTPSRGLSSKILASLRPTYLARKISLFNALLQRVPGRSFLTRRLPPPPPDEIVEATSDKWAARPYPISTKPLYLPGGEDNQDEEGEMQGREIELSPPPNNKKKKGEEEKITFELPVSYDLLDEQVERGVRRELLNPKGRRGRRKSLGLGRAGGGNEEGLGEKKVREKRGVQNGVCEGCGRVGIKVWRRGPGGRGTLCNACGDLFVAKQLPPLKKPGAMKAFLGENGDEEDQDQDQEGEGTKGQQSEENQDSGITSNQKQDDNQEPESQLKVDGENSDLGASQVINEQDTPNNGNVVNPDHSKDRNPNAIDAQTDNVSTQRFSPKNDANDNPALSENPVPAEEQGTSASSFKEQGAGVTAVPQPQSHGEEISTLQGEEKSGMSHSARENGVDDKIDENENHKMDVDVDA